MQSGNQFVDTLDSENEMMREIFSFLTPEECTKTALTNKLWSQIAKDDTFWKARLIKHFPHIFAKIKTKKDNHWSAEFGKAYQEEYSFRFNKKTLPLPRRIKQLFTFVKEGSIYPLKDLLTIEELDKEDINGVSLLEWAQKKKNQALLDFFYERVTESYKENNNAVDILKVDGQQRGILHWAILCHQPASTINLLIIQGADVEACVFTKYIYGCAIHIAVRYGLLSIVELLIDHKAELVNRQDMKGQTPAMWAAGHGYSEILDLLIEKRADLNLQSDNNSSDVGGFTALHYACKNGQTSVAKTLIEHDGVILDIAGTQGCGPKPIHLASKGGHFVIVKLLIEVQPNLLNQPDHCGQTPILWAAAKGHIDVVNYLAEKGADVNYASRLNAGENTAGYTPLHWAAKNGHTEVVKALIEKGADVERCSQKNQTPAKVASTYTNELKLLAYSKKTDRRPDDDYKLSFTLFGYHLKVKTGYSAAEKKSAKNAFIKVVFHGEDPSSLEPYQKILNNGELKSIYRGFRIR